MAVLKLPPLCTVQNGKLVGRSAPNPRLNHYSGGSPQRLCQLVPRKKIKKQYLILCSCDKVSWEEWLVVTTFSNIYFTPHLKKIIIQKNMVGSRVLWHLTIFSLM